MNFTEFMKYLINTSHWLAQDKVNMFSDFISAENLEDAYIVAITEKYGNDEEELDNDALCAFPSDLISCFIDWSKSTEVDWSAVNVRWQDYINEYKESCQL